MLGMMLAMLSSQAVAEVTPTFNSMTIDSSVIGTCITTPLQPSVVRLQWNVTNFNSGTQDYKVYRDGVLVFTTDGTLYTQQQAGLVENDTHHSVDITFNFRVDIVRSSDAVVLATRSASATKHYGNCV